jgi:hypothetical protein
LNFSAPVQINTNAKGAYGWNQAVHPEVDAVKQFSIDAAKAKGLSRIRIWISFDTC